MNTITVLIPSIEAAKQFVNIAEKYRNVAMKIESNNLMVDPHSIMGILSLDLDKPIVLQTDDNCPKSFFEEIKAFTVSD